MMTDTESTSTVAFVRKIVAAELLDLYGQGIETLPEGFAVPGLTPELMRYVATPKGRVDVSVWGTTFRTTLADLLAFRADLMHNPAAVSVRDLQTANEVVDRMFASLAEWLESSPHLKAS